MFNRAYYILLLYSIFIYAFSYAFVLRSDQNTLQIIEVLDEPNSHISIIQDTVGNKFLVKQSKHVERKLGLVAEVVAAYIAYSIGLPVNSVYLIPSWVDIPGKSMQRKPATLHTFVPGRTLSRPGPYNFIHIQQLCYYYHPPEKRGLRRSIITHMSLHKDLPPIVAFDTFVGCSDRKRKNLMYDKETDTFYLIDLEKAFQSGLAKLACNRIHHMIHSNEHFTQKEIIGIRRYRETLALLINSFSPNKVCNMIDVVMYLSGFNWPTSTIDHSITEQYKKTFTKNYAEAQKLLHLLDKFIIKYER